MIESSKLFRMLGDAMARHPHLEPAVLLLVKRATGYDVPLDLQRSVSHEKAKAQTWMDCLALVLNTKKEK